MSKQSSVPRKTNLGWILEGVRLLVGKVRLQSGNRDIPNGNDRQNDKRSHEAHEAHEEGSGRKNSSVRAFSFSCEYSDVAGFCKSATTAEIAAHVLTPGRYFRYEEVEDDGDPFEEKMPRLFAELHGQFEESAKLEAAFRANLKGLGNAL